MKQQQRTLLFYSAADDPVTWRDLAAEAMPAVRFLVVRKDAPEPSLDEVDFALVWRPPAGLLARCRALKMILSVGAGVDGILADPHLPRHVPLVRMTEPGLTRGMVEYVAWQVLDRHRWGPHYRRVQEARRWERLPEVLADERRVGIMGMGVLGQACAAALRQLGFQVRGWSRSPRTVEGVETFAGPAGLGPFLDGVEILVCLLPLTPETEGILARPVFDRMARGGHLINVARGGHLNEADLLSALDDGTLSTAVLDVFAPEPMPQAHPFWAHPAITITPHIASITPARSAIAHVAEQIRRFEAGLPVGPLVDMAAGY